MAEVDPVDAIKVIVGILLVVGASLLIALPMAGLTDTTSTDNTDGGGVVDSTSSANKTVNSVDPANPYGKHTLTVAINDSTGTGARTAIVEDALGYWETHSERYAGYPIEYELDPDHPDPDVQIQWAEDVSVCGLEYSTRTIGCADHIRDDAPETVEISMETGWVVNDTRDTLIHELGHTLGLDHGDEPKETMAAKADTMPKVIELDVGIHYESSDHDKDEIRDQIDHTLEYWQQWLAEEHGQNLTYNVTESSYVRTVGVRDMYLIVGDDPDACDGSAACAEIQDRSSPLMSDDYVITTANIREDAHGWFLGYYLDHYLQIDGEAPQPFQETDTDVILSEWWDDYE